MSDGRRSNGEAEIAAASRIQSIGAALPGRAVPPVLVAQGGHFATLIWYYCTNSDFLFHAWISFWDRDHPERCFDADFNPSNQKFGEIDQLGHRWEVYGGFSAKHPFGSIFQQWSGRSPKPLTLHRMDIHDQHNASIACALINEKVARWSSQRYTAPAGFVLQLIHNGTYNGAPFDLDSWKGNNCRTFAQEVYENVAAEIEDYTAKEGTNWVGTKVF